MSYGPFVRLEPGRHPRIDLARLLATFPEDDEDLDHITSPAQLARWERARAAAGPPSANARPVDVFVWARGPAPAPGLTQVGGTPYLARDAEWPRFDGEPASFLAQLSFIDSRDLLPGLPGDVLLVFARDDSWWYEPEHVRFVWQPAGLTELRAPEDCPASRLEHVHAHGILHRTVDDPRVPEEEDLRPLVAEATKVGGLRFDCQDMEAAPLRGARLLGALSSIQAEPGCAWPFADAEAPMTWTFDVGGIHHPRNQLMLGDMGTTSFHLRSDGTILTSGSCY